MKKLENLKPKTEKEKFFEDHDIIDICPRCKGGFNSLDKHLDCRECNNTGLVKAKRGLID